MDKIKIKRAYDKPEKGDGVRILVDRLWPRGITKQKAKIDIWAKDLAPSAELRTLYHKDKKARFKSFSIRYRAELQSNRDSLKSIKKEVGKKKVTLVTAVQEEDIKTSHVPIIERYF
ncbi:MarR family transcriptional regulator [bacterium]|nr:MarR family transcriptional regulator [bacterium]